MKFSATQPLSWIDGSGRRQMAVLSVEGQNTTLLSFINDKRIYYDSLKVSNTCSLPRLMVFSLI